MIYKNTQIVDGAGNIITPSLTAKADVTYNAAITAFMSAFDAKATSLLMSDTYSTNPSGSGSNHSTAHDLLKATVAAAGHEAFNRIWSAKTKTIYTQNPVSRQINLTSTVSSSAFENYYTLLAGKTGSLGGMKALVAIGMCEGETLAGSVIGASSDGGRFSAMKQLFDIARLALNGQDVTSQQVTDANGAAVCVLPKNPALWDGRELNTLFTQNANTQYGMASVTKVITALTALDYIKDLDATLTIPAEAISVGGSGAVFQEGDIVSYRDVLYAMMLPSSNMGAHALGYDIGRIILAT